MMKLEEDFAWYSIEHVNPEPWESPEGSIGRRNGGLFVAMHSTERMRNFQASVREEFELQNPGYRKEEGLLRVEFHLWRQLVEYDTDKRKQRGKVADATNCQKALEDALQGLLYDNDRDNRFVSCEFAEHDVETIPFILVKVSKWDHVDSTAGAMRTVLEAPVTEAPTNDHNQGIAPIF
jgi:Holliday junction resolvase RusA-like endonuclease